MKTLSLLILTHLLAAAAFAQTPAATPEPHGVSVVETRWHRQLYNPALDEDPLEASDATTAAQRDRKEANKAIDARRNGDRMPYRLPNPVEPPGGTVNKHSDDGASTIYVYEAKVSNSGAKKIRSIVWEYVLFDPDTQREVGNHAFETRVSIDPGKSKSLKGTTTQPPATVVDVMKSDREKHGQYSERVNIHRVEYEDGTFWEREPKQ